MLYSVEYSAIEKIYNILEFKHCIFKDIHY